ncbi:MAG TPA: ABC transporter ATP-binding protein [Planctomycetota bacterium]|nr:ABC transporter ATP-binding protein [Planctomycetota bacterium]
MSSESSADGAFVVTARGLAHRFGDVLALDGLDVSLPRGTVGLLGPNGAGKSTFLKVVLGLLRPDEGAATVLGEDPIRRGAAIRRRIGYMPERDCHLPNLTALDHVALAAELSGMPRNAAFRRAHETLHYVGLSEQRYRAVDGFSAGLRQRCKLAAALVHDPDLLVMDEPTNGLDPAGRREFLDLIVEVARSGISVVLSTHLLPDVQETCEHVVVVGRGRVVRQGTVAELTRGVERERSARFAGDPGPFLEALTRRGVACRYDASTGDLRLTLPEGAESRAVFEAAVEARCGLKRLLPARGTLEEVFLESLGGRRAGS